MASEWQEVEFGDILPDGTRNGVYKGKSFHGTGVKIVNMGELFAYPRLRAMPMKRVELTEAELERSSLHAGDLLFARRSLVAEGAGKCSIVMEVTEPTTFESSIIRARPDSKRANSLYLYYFFNSPQGRYLLGTILRQVAVSGITGTDLVKLKIPLPPLQEQRAIAYILGILDDKIELHRRMNQTLEEMARAVFKSWFVDFDPVHAKAKGELPFDMDGATVKLFPSEFENSEQGQIPKGWSASNVSQHFRLTMGQSPPGSTYNAIGNGTPFYQGRTDFGFRYPTRRVYCTSPTRFAEADDTLVSVRAPVGDINMAKERCAVGRGVAAIRHSGNSRSFTYYSMHELAGHFQKFEAEGTVFGCMNKSDFERLPFCAPSPEVLVAFDCAISPLDDRIEMNEEQTISLTNVRDTLLPKLISGKLRVPDAERVLERAM